MLNKKAVFSEITQQWDRSGLTADNTEIFVFNSFSETAAYEMIRKFYEGKYLFLKLICSVL